MAYEVDYNDQRFQNVEADKQKALTEIDNTYDDMINKSDAYFEQGKDASKKWAEEQKKIQQEQTDFAIEQIEQQKERANKDYIKEQSGAYVDWQKRDDEYGVQAEKMATYGLKGTGYSESAKVSMYNTYQNRVTAAKEQYNQAVINYNNSIKEARLQNNSVLAEISFNALQQQLELSLQGFQYKNSLLLEKANQKTNIENTYYARYQDVLNQINAENALEEEQRQFNVQHNQDIYIDKPVDDSVQDKENNVFFGPIATDYYRGAPNPDIATFGAFDNGYQPKGIAGHGTLIKTGKKEKIETVKQYGKDAGKKVTVTQNVWEAEDGTKWLWDGINNKYVPYD